MSSYDKYCECLETARNSAAEHGFSAEKVRVLPVTKNQTAQIIEELYSCGLREFAENRITVLEEKAKQLPTDIKWHFIGKIQSNKVRKILKLSHILHSVDSLDLLTRIDRIAGEEEVFPELFIEVNISGEESKSGISKEELPNLLSVQLQNSKIVGLMTMAPLESTEREQVEIFSTLKKLSDKFALPELSMGMSNDYRTAAACGSTIIRIGTALFIEKR